MSGAACGLAAYSSSGAACVCAAGRYGGRDGRRETRLMLARKRNHIVAFEKSDAARQPSPRPHNWRP